MDYVAGRLPDAKRGKNKLFVRVLEWSADGQRTVPVIQPW